MQNGGPDPADTRHPDRHAPRRPDLRVAHADVGTRLRLLDAVRRRRRHGQLRQPEHGRRRRRRLHARGSRPGRNQRCPVHEQGRRESGGPRPQQRERRGQHRHHDQRREPRRDGVGPCRCGRGRDHHLHPRPEQRRSRCGHRGNALGHAARPHALRLVRPDRRRGVRPLHARARRHRHRDGVACVHVFGRICAVRARRRRRPRHARGHADRLHRHCFGPSGRPRS